MNSKKLPMLPNERDLSTCVTQLKVLADSTRLAVIRLLLAHPLHVTELSEKLNVEQSLLSHHLKILRDAQLVEATREGKQVFYKVAEGVERSFTSAEAIDLGCCQLSFADAEPSDSAAAPAAAPARRPGRSR